MNHYVYYSYEEWGRGYIGVRSCRCAPKEDINYMGSFYDKSFKPTEKIILQEFTTRESALEAEIHLHDFYKVDVNEHFANKAKQTSTGFVSCGPRSEEFKSKISSALKGRKLSKTHIELVSKARSKKLKGKPLSEAHKKSLSKALKGRKISNHSFKGRLTKRSQKVTLLHIETNQIYEFSSISKAGEFTGIARSNIYVMLKKPTLRNKGYKVLLETYGEAQPETGLCALH